MAKKIRNKIDKKKRNINIIGLVIIIIVLFVIVIYQRIENDEEAYESDNVCIKDNCFEVEVVKTPKDRERGLMFRESLDNNAGMLFIFEQSGNYPFWMKNTLIPLDIIWIDEKKEVVFIGENIQPCIADPCPSYNPSALVLYVLEINAGKAEEIGLEVGDKLEFNLR